MIQHFFFNIYFKFSKDICSLSVFISKKYFEITYFNKKYYKLYLIINNCYPNKTLIVYKKIIVINKQFCLIFNDRGSEVPLYHNTDSKEDPEHY